jgi:mannose-1-phosphate guanylyltransferase/mannose-6-phosphate isomerase
MTLSLMPSMIHPVILAGGAGTRLWPASRKSYPKQFTELMGDKSLFQETVSRVQGKGFAAPTVVTNSEFRFITAEQLSDIGIDGADILIEAEGRNTAPAILTAALRLEATPDAIMLVLPSDHLIKDEPAFRAALVEGEKLARQGQLVTFGVKPEHAETGYGYLELSAQANTLESQPLRTFVEKPDLVDVEKMLETGRYLWNAGIFMFRVGTIIETFEILAPRLVMPCRAALATGHDDLCFFRLGAEAYARCEDISIDYAIMEAADALHVVPMACGWSDLGSWDSVWKAGTSDEAGNVLTGSSTQLDCTNSLLRSESDGIRLVGLGLKNIAAIAMGDAVLVANMDDAQRVKEVVAKLKIQKAAQAETFARCHRPWGYYETLSLGNRFQVKRIMVTPGAALSLQSHVHRAEHWVVVEGTAQVTVDADVTMISENQSVYIPLGAVHRLENRGKVPLHLIEVQSGAYLGEDDIVRYEDVYARLEPAAAKIA